MIYIFACGIVQHSVGFLHRMIHLHDVDDFTTLGFRQAAKLAVQFTHV
ncbi:Uncharacterised protein [Vibrio cholerae]|nr:Uncharacterised protein [Vibrio cholerae]CSI88204.1 Uncharacterised protein [Vibrio cholerae]